eukprot:symbB.v1.2.012144.t1/scaffold829.1/size159244/14
MEFEVYVIKFISGLIAVAFSSFGCFESVGSGDKGYNKGVRPLPGSIAELLQALDIEDDGTDAGINRQRLKRNYRDLSVKHHPDKTQDSSRFQNLREAYEILEDPVKILLFLRIIWKRFV